MPDKLDRNTQVYQTMKRAVIVVGFTCSNNCIFCVTAGKRSYPDKSTDEIRGEIEKAFENGARDLVFSGGECTVRKDIVELVAYARKVGFPVINIQTNGRAFASMDFCKKMLLAGMTALQPALHGHTAELHDSLTRRKGSFRQTVLGIHNIRTMTRGSARVLTNTVVVKANYRFLPDIIRLLIGLRVQLSQFAFVHAMGHAGKNFKRVVPRKTDVLPYLKKAIDIGEKAGLRVVAEAMPLCLMKGYEQHVSEFYIPSTELWDRGHRIPKFEIVRINDAKEKFPQCQECCCQNTCEGPWREYSRHFGSDEFQPIVSR
jgi:MoaA/NifB/PqqE/SkfB family radical SAM enzyme